MKNFINKNNDKFLLEVWSSLKELYATIKESEHLNYVSKTPIGYTVKFNRDMPNFDTMQNLRSYFNKKGPSHIAIFEIKKPGWDKHVDGSTNIPAEIYTGSCVWPIENCGPDNITRWYKQTKGEYVYEEYNSQGQKNSGYWNFTKDSEFDLLDETCVDGPHIIRTDIPHSVNTPESTRVICSYKLGTTNEISWEDIYKEYKV